MFVFWGERGTQQGFSLLELVIVIALINLILGIGVLSFNTVMERIRLDNTAKLMQSQLRLIQSQAISEGQYYEMRFDITRNRYRILRGSEPVKTVNFESGISYYYTATSGSSSFPYLRYYPTGAPSSGATIAIEDNHAHKRYIIINPAIGRVRVSQQPPL